MDLLFQFICSWSFYPYIETGNNSSVSEIEPPEVIEPIGTVSPDITHEEIINRVEGTTANQLNEVAVTELPIQVPFQPEISENEIQQQQLPEQFEPEIASTTQRKPRRKGKKPNVQEDNNIDSEFASRLDMSCADAETIAPQIENAHVSDYIRYLMDL